MKKHFLMSLSVIILSLTIGISKPNQEIPHNITQDNTTEDNATQAAENLNRIFSNLADRMYCISEMNGNSDGDIEKELDERTLEIKEILQNNALDPEKNIELFFKACAYGNRAIIDLFVNANFNVNPSIENVKTPAMIAALHGNIETLEALIKHGADLNATDSGGNAIEQYATFVPENLHIGMNMFVLLPKYLIAQARYKNQNPFAECKKKVMECKQAKKD